MEGKTFVFMLILSLAVILSLGGILAYQSTEMSPKKSKVLEECQVLSENSKDATNIVFFSDRKTAEKYSKYIMSIPPYSENKEAFNFYLIEGYTPECELYKGIALYCHSSELVKKSGSCPNDQIVVIQDEDSNIRSSAYLNVISLNKNLPLSVFTHEFGHTFASLADEYTPAAIPVGAKNCVKSCEDFKGEKEGCYQGCSKESYYRSVDSGVMRTLSSENYGSFDEEIVKSKMVNKEEDKITGMAGLEELEGRICEDEEYYLINGEYDAGNIIIKDKTIEKGCFGSNGEGGIFSYSLVDEESKELVVEGFRPELIFTDSLNGGTTEDYSGEISIKVPIVKNAENLKIIKEGVEVESIILGDIDGRMCQI